MSKPKYKAVIFDFDDTLVETRLIKMAHHIAVAKKFYDINLTEEVFLEHYGKPFNTLIKTLYQDSDTLENMIAANVTMRNDFLKKVYPASVDVVKTLLDHDIKIGILSATNRDFVMNDLNRLNFPVDRMSVVQGADETEVHKPDPNVFMPILDKLKKQGIEKEDIVYVGDSLSDLKATTAAGIDFIAVTTGLYSQEDFKNNGAEVIIKEIKEVVEKII
ncbi:hypothetical protein A3A95_03635 [Candidatus Nomurabacteria bacterium RIFCSPLOWO2_01_FULL_39_18]|uniref:Phosphoglycolate phosphatase n=1 Tax=Candidatus Nomurabacteria bacterium RIFCSPHIGHO2_01_FULL_40_24b TaxID=1801739 RepID=A0A1F6V6H3_9BACT|nr:MAG: hypothetical protein A2647_04885 [Candidatus Nomurabacteria bacterium RIFCSPHIGHO2_01_FULL_40_24b]OGI89200.1 MAG: hypothetical protein A3A95_03635 [Candidatus Nomurabacteria bacterium RIFCSPLOWO2_01_FULL_39_18]